jgi:multidrug efflux pump subunit AcrB
MNNRVNRNNPVKTVNGSVIYLGDVAHARAGFHVQTNIVRHHGRRGSLLSVWPGFDPRHVRQVRDALPSIAATLPQHLYPAFVRPVAVCPRCCRWRRLGDNHHLPEGA